MSVNADRYKREVLLCFWLTIELGRIKVAKMIYGLDPIIAIVMRNLRE